MKRGWLAAVAVVASVGFALASSCGGNDETTNPCPNGICGTGGNNTTGSSSGGNGQGGGAVTCGWLCSPWDTQGNGDMATRTCVDVDGCADPNLKPAESAMLPALDENFYRCNVEPIFDHLCSQMACHGVEPDLNNGDPGRALRIYHRGRMRVTGQMIPGWPGCLNQPPQPSESCIGSIECACVWQPHLAIEWQRNFDAARGFGLGADGMPLANVEDSELLQQPLRGGGLPHAGIKIWNVGDANYQTIKDFLSGMPAADCMTTN
jgi:hypothetical protein